MVSLLLTINHIITKLKTNNAIESTFIKLSESLSNDRAQLPKTLFFMKIF